MSQPRHNNAIIDMSYPRIDEPINEVAFRLPDDGHDRSARNRNNESVKAIVSAATSAVTIDKQILALRDALGHPCIRAVASSIVLNLEEVQVSLYIVDNMNKVIAAKYENCKSKNNKRLNNDAHTFMNAISLCIVETPPSSPEAASIQPRGKNQKTSKYSNFQLKKTYLV